MYYKLFIIDTTIFSVGIIVTLINIQIQKTDSNDLTNAVTKSTLKSHEILGLGQKASPEII